MKQRIQVCHDILEQLKTKPDLLRRFVTNDESWIFEYDPPTKRSSLKWKIAILPTLKTSEEIQVQSKGDMDCFFRCERCRAYVVFVTRPNNQLTHLQRHFVTFNAIDSREKTRFMEKKLLAPPSRQCFCTQYLDY